MTWRLWLSGFTTILILFSGAATAQTKLVFAIGSLPQPEHGGFYAALAANLYQKAGIDIVIRSEQLDSGIENAIQKQGIDLVLVPDGFLAFDLTLRRVPVRAVMATFQKTPDIFLMHQRNDIKSIADMKGLPIIAPRYKNDSLWNWLKLTYAFTDQQLRPYAPDLAKFLSDSQAIQIGSITEDVYRSQSAGVNPSIFLPSNDGFPSYAGLILMHDRLIYSSPDIVEGFIKSSIDGWNIYLYGDSSPANTLIKQKNPAIDDAMLRSATAEMREKQLIDSGDAKILGIGAMTDARWEAMFEFMAQQGQVPANLAWKNAYTTVFVNRRYGLE